MTIAGLSQICRNFPVAPLVRIERESQLDAIESALKGNLQVIFLDGEDGIGKTTILGQLMERRPDTTVGIFIAPVGRVSYSKEFLNLAITEQLYWIFEGKRFPNNYASSSDVLKMMLRLQKFAKTTPVTFVIDGITDIPLADRQQVVNYLFAEALQLGMREFRYVISGSVEKIGLPGADRIAVQTQHVLPLDKSQIKEYFSGFDLDERDLQDLKTFSNGFPSRVEIALRALSTGQSLDTIVTHQYKGSDDYFEMEWATIVNSASANIKLLLSLLVFSTRLLSTEELAKLLSMTMSEVKEMLTQIHFVSLSCDDDIIRFRSDAQRRFVGKRLENFRAQAQNILIQDFMIRPTDKDTLSFLPAQLTEAGKSEQIIDTLTPDHFKNLFAEEKSISALRNQAFLGRETAEKLERISNTFEFAVLGSVLIEIENSDSSRQLVQALLTLGRFEKAMSIAGQASTLEDRFSLLALVGSFLISKKENLPSELKEKIVEASKHIDFENLGTRASIIANNLISIDADLAIEVLEMGVKRQEGSNEHDFAFASLHAAISTSSLDAQAREQAQKKARDRISDERIQDFAEAATSVFAKYSADRLIEKLEKLGFEHRLYFARVWLAENFTDPSASTVAEYALNLVVENTEYVPNLTDFLPIAKILPLMDDRAKARSILENIEAQKAVVGAHGTSSVYVRLNMLFLLAEAKENVEKATERAFEIFSKIDDISDIGTKTTCFAWVLHYMHECVGREAVDNATDLTNSCAARMLDCIEILLSSTVDHFNVTKSAIRALAPNYAQKAIDLVRHLNTIRSRDKAFRYLSQVLIENKTYSTGFDHILLSIRSIENLIDRDHAGMDMLSKLKDNDDFNIRVPNGNTILSYWKCFQGPDVRLLGLVFTYAMLYRNYRSVADGMNLEQNLSLCWDKVPDEGYKVNLGFQVVEILSSCNKPLAEKLMDELLLDYAGHTLIAQEVEPVINSSIRLCIRSFSGLVNAKAIDENAYARLVTLIRTVSGTTEPMRLWVDLAVRCWAAGDKARCEDITSKYIRALIDSVPEEFFAWKSYLIAEAAPALYISSPNLAENYVCTLPREEQDIARQAICITLCSQLSPYDPKPVTENADYYLDYSRAVDIVAVTGKMKSDSCIMLSIATLCDCLISKKNRTNFTKGQKKKIIEDLAKIIATTLPDLLNIKHQGFVIAASAKLLRVRSEIEKVDVREWEKLKHEAEQIPNIADRALVFCIVGVQASSKELGTSKGLFKEAKELAGAIPSMRDRIDRFRWMSEMVGKTDPGFCHSILKEAFQLSRSLENSSDIEDRQRQILDVAHQIDPKFAEELLILLDSDPARLRAKQLSSHVKVLKARKKLFDSKDKETSELGLTDEELIETAAGNFRSLLAGRYRSRHLDDMAFLLKRASNLSLSKSFPIWCWFVENVNRRFAYSPRELSAIAAILDSNLSAAELAFYFAGRTRTDLAADNSSTTLFRDGDRDAALVKMRIWILQNVEEYVLISDPYFGPDEFELVKLIHETKPNVIVRLLLCEKYVNGYLISGNYERLFRDKWSDISDENPPRIDIVIVGVKPDGIHPIHDRWLITKNSGIRMGTSIHSLGIGKTSEISEIASEELGSRRQEIELYFSRTARTFMGVPIKYSMVDI